MIAKKILLAGGLMMLRLTVFFPQSLIPDIDFQGSGQELIQNQNTNG